MAKKAGDTEKLGDLGLLMGAHDWQQAMQYAKFEFSDIKKVLVAVEGENEGRAWKLIVKLRTGNFGWLSARCDYSGWDCQSSGNSGTVATATEARNALLETLYDNREKVEFDIECSKTKGFK